MTLDLPLCMLVADLISNDLSPCFLSPAFLHARARELELQALQPDCRKLRFPGPQSYVSSPFYHLGNTAAFYVFSSSLLPYIHLSVVYLCSDV